MGEKRVVGKSQIVEDRAGHTYPKKWGPMYRGRVFNFLETTKNNSPYGNLCRCGLFLHLYFDFQQYTKDARFARQPEETLVNTQTCLPSPLLFHLPYYVPHLFPTLFPTRSSGSRGGSHGER